MYEADSDMESQLEWVYLEPEEPRAVSISSDDDTDSTEESDGKYDSVHDSDVDMCMENDVDALDGVELDGDVDMARDSDDEEEEDEEEENEEEENEDEDEDEDEDDGKEPRTIGQGEIDKSFVDHVDATVHNQPSCYLSTVRKCVSIPQGKQPQTPTHDHKPRSLAHDHELWRLIPPVGWSFWGL